jgi:hypothetical protein
MSDAPATRSGRSGGIFVAVLVGGSAVAVAGWYLVTNRHGADIDASGFDMTSAPASRKPVPAASFAFTPASPAAPSSLGMMKGDSDIVIGDGTQASPPAAAAAAKPGDKKAQANLGFTEAARKHERDVQNWAMRMTNQYPAVRQYGKDWMSYPDLKKLNDDYSRDHDPIAFMVGLSHAPNFGTMLKKYAGVPEMRTVVMQGMKESPPELTSSAMEVMQNDHVMKDLVANVASGMGLPPSVTTMINGAAEGDGKIDQAKVLSDVMNNPAMRGAMQQNGAQQAPPVSLPNQR